LSAVQIGLIQLVIKHKRTATTGLQKFVDEDVVVAKLKTEPAEEPKRGEKR
jgi:hypothetical protein